MKDLFSEFSPVSAEQWKQQIERDLKGEPYDELVWRNDNGFDLQPFYTKEDLTAEYHPAFSHTTWRMAAEIHEGSSAANSGLLKQLRHGADAIWTRFEKGVTQTALKGVDLDLVSLSFSCEADGIGDLSEFISSRKVDAPSTTIFPGPASTKEELSRWISSAAGHGSPVNWMSVPSSGWSHAGAIPAYEVALAFAFLTELSDASKGRKPRTVSIRTAVDSDFFVQIAKLRAIRRLWELLKQDLWMDCDLFVQCETALVNKSALDPHTNLLRTTVESAAAILGGCNELLVRPYDLYNGSSDTGRRLALNQHHILSKECYLDRIADAGAGSYYIETLTDKLAERSLDTLQTIMKEGGFCAVSSNGMVKKELLRQAEARKAKIDRLEEAIIGVNKFRSPQYQAPDENIWAFLRDSGIAAVVAGYEREQILKKA